MRDKANSEKENSSPWFYFIIDLIYWLIAVLYDAPPRG